ncbi:putative shugoshin c terminal domain-containing protein [Botrytis fragariae]|uniref:Putative shugoshin c terminal domain-containing protein n=1 Tax=Botrytis fragariae TaxID=1964551 RepID=A0A8H6AWM1_9HELO|nr:putative shugoshin c terminal domain-containing protein [Botrytis fragariae]KAF5874849.1 putative shugoshin c terminal domain-containing protein [Botrytis fragariae]
MARLNEPAASLESIESLKRKYKRQNRDIASVNSSQAVRIRSLENETSKLLAENLELREENLRLRSEIDNGKARRAADRVNVVKSQLEERLQEIGALISGLGEESPQRKRSPHVPRQFGGLRAGSNPPRSPKENKWDNLDPLNEDGTSPERKMPPRKTTASSSEDIGSPDGKLPPILENKYYPRKTLEHQEIENMLAEVEAENEDSPDIGPPPVSQFVDEDPVKIDLAGKLAHEREDELDSIISTNLEQRKKRKDSMVASDIRRNSRLELPAKRESTGTLKSGAKRKLSAREDEELESTNANDIDDFQFTRLSTEERAKTKLAVSSAKENTKSLKDVMSSKGLSKDKPALAPSTRKVLAAKSVNNSPKKGASSRNSNHDGIKPGKLNLFKESLSKEMPREEKKMENIEPIRQTMQPPLQVFNMQAEPETPAPVDIFSPLSSHPSTNIRVESRDTPPPSEMRESAEGQRPSRRARNSISYAEPNLRDKMRRPGKEFVNAVTADGKVRAIRVDEEAGPATISKIKAEPESEDAWKQLSTASNADHSPLNSKASAPLPDMLPSSITDHRRRRESILYLTESGSSASGSKSVAELLAESRKIKAKSKEQSTKGDDIKAALEDMDIYEFQGSPKRDSEEPKVIKEEKSDRASSRFSRRASAIPVGDQDFEPARKFSASTGPSQSGSRRRQSALPSSTIARSASAQGHESERDTTDSSDKSLRKSVSSTSMAGAAAANANRSDRISSRRRSMML